MNTTRFAPLVLRLGLAALFLWFGLSQVVAPAEWLAWVPAWATTLSWISPETLILFNGGFESVFGIALALGFRVRLTALLLSLHIFFIAYEVGYNDIGVRDFAIGVSTLAVALSTPDTFTLDHSMRKDRMEAGV